MTELKIPTVFNRNELNRIITRPPAEQMNSIHSLSYLPPAFPSAASTSANRPSPSHPVSRYRRTQEKRNGSLFSGTSPR